jgi:hypothetical protein
MAAGSRWYLVSQRLSFATSHILRHPADNLCWGEWLLNISSSIIGLMFPDFPVLQIIKAASEMMTYFFARILRSSGKTGSNRDNWNIHGPHGGVI